MGWMEKLKAWSSRTFLPSTRRGRRARFDRRFHQARRLYAEGRYQEFEAACRQALRIAEEFGPTSPDLADCLSRVGEFQHSVGTYGQAEELIKRSLEIREGSFGPDSPEVVSDLNDLALLHYAQGKYAEGEVLYRRLLPLLEAQRGPDDREVSICLDNFAAVLRKQKRDAEAAPLQARAREIRRRLRGE